MASIADIFKAETEFPIKATELQSLMREAVKAEFLLNAAECDVPPVYMRQMATGEKEVWEMAKEEIEEEEEDVH